MPCRQGSPVSIPGRAGKALHARESRCWLGSAALHSVERQGSAMGTSVWVFPSQEGPLALPPSPVASCHPERHSCAGQHGKSCRYRNAPWSPPCHCQGRFHTRQDRGRALWARRRPLGGAGSPSPGALEPVPESWLCSPGGLCPKGCFAGSPSPAGSRRFAGEGPAQPAPLSFASLYGMFAEAAPVPPPSPALSLTLPREAAPASTLGVVVSQA